MSLEFTRTTLFLASLSICNCQLAVFDNERNNKECIEQAKSPYFDIELIVGKPWRIYYTWNVEMESACLDMTVKNATNAMVHRIYNDMHDYLKMQPEWDAAALYLTMGSASHELLLFTDQGAEGSFVAVPNVIKEGHIVPTRKSVPTLKFFLKLVNNGKFLLMMDCNIGVASLLSRQRPPYRSEVMQAAKSLNLGYGSQACISDMKSEENLGHPGGPRNFD